MPQAFITRPGARRFAFATALFGLSLPACVHQAPQDREALQREQDEARRLQEEADFVWIVSEATKDSFGTRKAGSREISGLFTRQDMFEWLRAQETNRELAVIVITRSVEMCMKDPARFKAASLFWRGPDPYWRSFDELMDDVEAKLRQQGFKRVVFEFSPNIGYVSIFRDSGVGAAGTP